MNASSDVNIDFTIDNDNPGGIYDGIPGITAPLPDVPKAQQRAEQAAASAAATMTKSATTELAEGVCCTYIPPVNRLELHAETEEETLKRIISNRLSAIRRGLPEWAAANKAADEAIARARERDLRLAKLVKELAMHQGMAPSLIASDLGISLKIINHWLSL